MKKGRVGADSIPNKTHKPYVKEDINVQKVIARTNSI